MIGVHKRIEDASIIMLLESFYMLGLINPETLDQLIADFENDREEP